VYLASFFADTLHELVDMCTGQLVVNNAPISAAYDQL